jgi:NAD(P)-dependent dehydrogenase (short-subunit alcohol dehydrogenase family)
MTADTKGLWQMRFSDRVLLCTGGGSGIGAAVSRRYAADGGRVAVLDIDGDAAAKVTRDLDDAISIQADVSSESDVRRAVDRVLAEYGRIDAVYNGAAILLAADVLSSSAADFQRHLSVNAIGTFLVCQATAAALTDAGGAVVNTSSVVVDIARKERGLYAAAKGAIPPLTRHLALEMAPRVRVNAVSPGPTLTGMTHDHYRAMGETMEEGLTAVGAGVMLQRVAAPDELAAAICFLLSDDASYVTGTVLVVDGGMTAK